VPPARAKTTVLVVEDDRALRTFYQSALMIAGYAVVTAEDGIEALRTLEGYDASAVVLDLGLPRMSGRDVTRELLANEAFRGIPIVVVTGSEVPEPDARSFACVLRKPVTAESLIAAVNRCLARARDE
jgi:CheY-like chemotaxis protein